MLEGISIKPTIGVGDALQFSSVPENYFTATGKMLYDVSRPWFFDHNPYVIRDPALKPGFVREMWNFSPKQYDWPKLREEGVYLSNAEIHASVWNIPVTLNRPRLYKYEEFPFEKRKFILLHIDGRSHGRMPDHIVRHIVDKYSKTGFLAQIGSTEENIGIPKIITKTLWDLAKVVSSCRMLIGMDSGPSWVAACYPDIVIKKIRFKPSVESFATWVPLAADNIHSHWDSREHQIFNPSDKDVGFTSSYLKI